MTTDPIDLTDPIFSDEEKARAWFEAARWPNGPVCPHCGNTDGTRIYDIAANVAHGVREGLKSCQDCLGQFTVMTGSVMEVEPSSPRQVGARLSPHGVRKERYQRPPDAPHLGH